MQHLINGLTKLSGEMKRKKKNELTMIFTEFSLFHRARKFFCHHSPNTVDYALPKALLCLCYSSSSSSSISSSLALDVVVRRSVALSFFFIQCCCFHLYWDVERFNEGKLGRVFNDICVNQHEFISHFHNGL